MKRLFLAALLFFAPVAWSAVTYTYIGQHSWQHSSTGQPSEWRTIGSVVAPNSGYALCLSIVSFTVIHNQGPWRIRRMVNGQMQWISAEVQQGGPIMFSVTANCWGQTVVWELQQTNTFGVATLTINDIQLQMVD